MRFSSYVRWVLSGEILPFVRLSRSTRELYRLCFLSRAASLGLLDLLVAGPRSLPEIVDGLKVGSGRTEAVAAFLELGGNVGEIRETGGKYRLAGSLAKAFSRTRFDPLLAMAQEVAGLHVPYLLAAPGSENGQGHAAGLTDDFAGVIARSSRICEPVLNEVTDRLVPESGPFALLEIGCGSGVYLFRALCRNPQLQAVGVEVQPAVAESVRAEAEARQLLDRVRIVQADVRTLQFKEAFDLITLHNNIYYFPESARPGLLSQLVSWLKPGGKITISSSSPGGGVFSSYMRLWAAMTEGAGPLPDGEGFHRQLSAAGLVDIRSDKPVLFDSYRVFVGTKPGH